MNKKDITNIHQIFDKYSVKKSIQLTIIEKIGGCIKSVKQKFYDILKRYLKTE